MTAHSTDSIDVLGEKRKILYLSDARENGVYFIRIDQNTYKLIKK